MGEVRSQGVCDKSEPSAALRRDVAGPCEFHCFPHGAGNHRGPALCSCQLLILQAGGQQKTYSLLLSPPPSSLLGSSVCSKEPWLPPRHLLLPVSGPCRGQQTHPMESCLVNFYTRLKLVCWCPRDIQRLQNIRLFLPLDPHKIFCCVAESPYNSSASSRLICLSDCAK